MNLNIPMTDPWDERYTYLLIYHKNQLKVGKYSSPMDPMGYFKVIPIDFFTIHGSYGIEIGQWSWVMSEGFLSKIPLH